MKKHLLASSALVAAGCVALASGAAAQGKPTLSVGGYLHEIVGVIINKPDNAAKTAALDVHNDGEIHFRGNATLDNGIKIRAQVELEISEHSNFARTQSSTTTVGENSDPVDGKHTHPATTAVSTSQDIIDEVYVNVSGSFGQLRLGQDDSVGWLMLAGYSGSWATQVGQNLAFDSNEWVPGVGASAPWLLSIVSLDGDPERLSYVSPRISGLQVGVSYTPNKDTHDDWKFATTDKVHNEITGAINFTGKFGETGVGGGFVYQTAKRAEGTMGDDPKEWAAALRVDFGPARVAAAYRNITKVRRIFDVGVRYKMGANSFSLTYANGQQHKSAGTGKRTAAMLSYARQLGAGVKWHTNLIHTDGGNKNTGLALTSGIGLSF